MHTVTSDDKQTRLHFNSDFSGQATVQQQGDYKGVWFDAHVLKALVDLHVKDAVAEARATAIEEVAQFLEDQVNAYPADVWPDDSTHPDAIAARTMRLMLPKLAAAIRRLGGEGR